MNAAAHSLGQFEDAGLLRADAEAALTAAALAVGLTTTETAKTFASGWEAGRQKPREIPADGAGPALSWKTPKPEAKPAHRAKLLRLSTVEPEDITWVWPGRLARAKLTLLAGDPGLGKSFVTLDIAARISTGASWPDGGVASRGDVLLLSAEDGIADTIVPRLLRMGADMERVHVLESVLDRADDHERLFRLQTDLAALEDAIEQVHPVLVVVDPLSAYLAGVDSHKAAEVRGILAPLMTLGERTGVGLLCNAHLNKDESRSALYRVSGSLDFVAAARAAFLVVPDPDDGDRRLVLTMKMNIAAKPAGIAFSIVDGAVAWDDRPVTVDLAHVLAPSRESRSKVEAAEMFLREMLAHGPVAEAEIIERAGHEDITERTLRRAKTALAVGSEKRGLHGGWIWSLPTTGQVKSEDGQKPLRQDLDTYVVVQDGHDGNVPRCPSAGGVENGRLRGQAPPDPECLHETHRRFWRHDEGKWRCAICQPPAMPEEVQWFDLDNPDEPNDQLRVAI